MTPDILLTTLVLAALYAVALLVAATTLVLTSRTAWTAQRIRRRAQRATPTPATATVTR